MLNSKIEYSRTFMSQLETSLGRNKEKQEDRSVMKEKDITEKIRMLHHQRKREVHQR